MSEMFERNSAGRGRRGCGMNPRLLVAIGLAVVGIISYFSSSQMNPVTGEKQYVKLDMKDEVALGLQSAPEMAKQFGGPSPNTEGRARVERIGQRIVERSDANKGGYPFQFHLLDDDKTVNAFALPGGQIFITDALFNKLTTDGELAGVLAHEITHVVGRHGAEHMAKQGLQQALIGAGVMATSDNASAAQRNAMIAAVVGNFISMRYGREDETESDTRGIEYMVQAGYDPNSMIKVMEVLKEAAGGGARQPEWMSSHPDPGNRIEKIKETIQQYPGGLPPNLEP